MRYEFNGELAIHPDITNELIAWMTGKAAAPTVEKSETYCIDLEGRRTDDEASSGGMIAIVPVYGPLSPSGYYGTSLDDLPRRLRALDHNSRISSIILDVRSPGGTVSGTPEAAQSVREVRDGGRTSIVAIANGMMASGALWIGTSAEKVYITPSGQIGSIGVMSMYQDTSEAWKQAGINWTISRVPEKKNRFTTLEPMTESMREDIEKGVQRSYEQFKSEVAANRKVAVEEVESRFGAGEMLRSDEALSAGLVDGITTLDQLVASMLQARKQQDSYNRARAQIRSAEIESV